MVAGPPSNISLLPLQTQSPSFSPLVERSLLVITVLIHFQVKPECVSEFKTLTLANAGDRLKSRGNLRFELYQQDDNPNQFFAVEVFQSQVDIDAYYATESYRLWHEAAAEMLVDYFGHDMQQLFPNL